MDDFDDYEYEEINSKESPFVVIEITDDSKLIAEKGKELAKKIMKDCELKIERDDIKLIGITGNGEKIMYYAIVPNDYCIKELIKAGKVKYMQHEDYLDIVSWSPERIGVLEMETIIEEYDDCIIL